MIALDVEQGSSAWYEARLGIPTASRFGSILTPKTRKYASGAATYRNELIAEWMLGYPLDDASTDWMARGSELEAEAIRYYEFQRELEVTRVGFILRDDGKVGGSPDGLVGNDGGLEIKCFSAGHHVGCLLGEDPATMTQVQGNIWLAEREWWDVLAYSPSFPPVLSRVGRDDKYITDLEKALGKFLDELDAAKRLIEGMGAAGRIDGSGLTEALLESLREGVEPDPDELTHDEIAEMVTDLHKARKAGLLESERENEIRELAIKGQWTEARAGWAEARAALYPDEVKPEVDPAQEELPV